MLEIQSAFDAVLISPSQETNDILRLTNPRQLETEEPFDALADYYRPIERALEKITDSRSHLCFIRGAPGIGKSYQIRKHLRHLGLPFVEVTGFTSEGYLYRLLFENKDKVIWFQDVAQLLDREKVVGPVSSVDSSIMVSQQFKEVF